MRVLAAQQNRETFGRSFLGTIRNVRLTIPAVLVLSMGLISPAEGQTVLGSPQPPAQLLGEFIDDYGIRYSISPKSWFQGPETRYDILEWDVEGRSLLSRNADSNPSDAGLWTRIDWVLLGATGEEYQWAFCYAVYNASSPVSAMSAQRTTRATPRTGCNGFPFSRMRRVR